MVQGAAALVEMLDGYADGARRDEFVAKIQKIEHNADEVTHETVALMHNTFVTPFDRDQINKLIQRMDDILDLIQDTAESLTLYDVHTLTAEVRADPRLADMFVLLHTSLSGVFNQAMVKKVGANEFLAKFNPDLLASVVAQRIRNLEGVSE